MYELIQISGNDARDFLQGQLTQDIKKLDAAISLPAAWCNPKGRVIAILRLLSLQDSIGLVISKSLTDSVVKRLGMYRLRAKVDIGRPDGNWRALAVSDAQAFAALDSAGLLPAAGTARANHRLIAVDNSTADRFVEVFGTDNAFTDAGLRFDAPLSDADWSTLRIRAGLADITTENTEKYTPHMLNLDRLGAISFNKGCYTGQEVVARTENLGASKRRLLRYRCDAPGIAIGDRLAQDGRDVGTVVNVCGNDLLAVAPVAGAPQPLTINNAVATPIADAS